jgi:hypothetical protein
MTLLSVVRDVCACVGVDSPTAVVGATATDRTMFEMLALANETVDSITADTRDWKTLIKTVVLTGDGVINSSGVWVGTEAFPLPADYRRLLKAGNLWRSSSTIQPMRFFPDTDEWMQRRAANYVDGRGEWTIYGGAIHIQPIMGAATSKAPAITARFAYLSKNSIALAAGGFGDRFAADGDTFLLPERVFRLGMVWRWKAGKGSPYAEDMGSYENAMANAMGADAPAPIILDRLPISAAANVAYPFWPVPTP